MIRNKETGKLYETIQDALIDYTCPGHCWDCQITKAGKGKACGLWVNENQTEALQIMGLEIVDDAENSKAPDRSRTLSTLLDKFAQSGLTQTEEQAVRLLASLLYNHPPCGTAGLGQSIRGRAFGKNPMPLQGLHRGTS